MDMMYAQHLVAAIALVVGGWCMVGFIALIVFIALWNRHNGCWACRHGDVRDPIARWLGRMSDGSLWDFFLTLVAAPVLVPIGAITFYRVQLPFERARKREESAE